MSHLFVSRCIRKNFMPIRANNCHFRKLGYYRKTSYNDLDEVDRGEFSVAVVYFMLIAITATTTLEAMKDLDEEEIKEMVRNHFENISDVDSKYVMNQAIANSISKMYKGKVNAFPLFKISIKIDKQPVKIPWELNKASVEDQSVSRNRYIYYYSDDQ